MRNLREKAQQIQLVIFDVDGVLTDGSLFLGDDGEEYKAFHSRDGHGMRMLQEQGVHIAIITGRRSNVVTHRMQDLGVELVYQGQRDKLPAFERILQETGVAAEFVAYVGDDVVDLPVMRRVGLAIAVQDAHHWTQQQAHWVTAHGGGRGAAREVCEFILEAQGKLATALGQYDR